VTAPALPASMTEEAVTEWLFGEQAQGVTVARAVIALVEARVREMLTLARNAPSGGTAGRLLDDALVDRVMGRRST